MIEDKADYREYVRADMEALCAKTRHALWHTDNSMVWLTDPVARWERLLRRCEYWENCHGGRATKPWRVFLRWRFQRLSARLGFSIPLNVCGPGLCILHYGSIVVSRHARIGARCTLNSCVNIGANPSGGVGFHWRRCVHRPGREGVERDSHSGRLHPRRERVRLEGRASSR